MKPTVNQVLHIWDHPESRISFMESTLGNQDWRATIYPASPHGEQHNLPALAVKLKNKGYEVQQQRDPNGIQILHIHHLGADASLDRAIESLGWAKGIAHKVSHFDHSIAQGTDIAKKGYQLAAGNSARLLSSLYLVGDLILSFAGGGNKPLDGLENSFKTSNTLYSIFGTLSALQSIIYLAYADEGSDAQLSHLKRQSKEAMQAGKDPFDPINWRKEGSRFHGPLGSVDTFLRKYPIQLGALSQILAFASLFASGAKRYQVSKSALTNANDMMRKELQTQMRSSAFDMASAPLSILSWAIIAHPPKVGEEGQQSHHLLQSFKENPSRLSALLSGASSILGIVSGKERSNTTQLVGQSAYLLGDAAMFSLKTNEYGKSGGAAQHMAAEATADFLAESTMVMGPATLHDYVDKLSSYMAKRIYEQEACDTDKKLDAQAKTVIDTTHIQALKRQIAMETMRHLSGKPLKAERIAHQVAQLCMHFPETSHTKLMQDLSQSISQMTGVYATQEELQKMTQDHYQNLIDAYHPQFPSNPPAMKDITRNISDILLTLPPMQAGQSANQLYDILSQHIQTSPHDQMHLEHAFKQQVSQNTGIPTPTLTALQHELQAPTRNI